MRGPGGRLSTVDRSLRATKDRLLFLCGETQMTPRDIRINTDVFVWPQRMEKIFADHEGIIKDKTDSYQEGLKQRRERFQQDLESYQKQLIIQRYQNLRLKPVVIYINIQRRNLFVIKKQKNIIN